LASQAIFDSAQATPDLAGMGTTLTGLCFHGQSLTLCHVGDSRAYLMRDGRARQLTEDHSWIQEQVRAGLLSPGDAMVSRFRNIITRSVGFEPTVAPDLFTMPVEPGDCYLALFGRAFQLLFRRRNRPHPGQPVLQRGRPGPGRDRQRTRRRRQHHLRDHLRRQRAYAKIRRAG
jgi:hypothetical protein